MNSNPQYNSRALRADSCQNFSIRRMSKGCARSAKRLWLAACRLKSNNERAERTASIAGSPSVTTRSVTRRNASGALVCDALREDIVRSSVFEEIVGSSEPDSRQHKGGEQKRFTIHFSGFP